jgi:hypothetical protein
VRSELQRKHRLKPVPLEAVKITKGIEILAVPRTIFAKERKAVRTLVAERHSYARWRPGYVALSGVEATELG